MKEENKKNNGERKEDIKNDDQNFSYTPTDPKPNSKKPK